MFGNYNDFENFWVAFQESKNPPNAWFISISRGGRLTELLATRSIQVCALKILRVKPLGACSKKKNLGSHIFEIKEMRAGDNIDNLSWKKRGTSKDPFNRIMN